MEDLTFALIGVGGLLLIINTLVGMIELVIAATIRPPEHRSFTQIRLAVNQNQTIMAPALGTLISSFLVSISASFFFEIWTSGERSLHLWADFFFFIAFLIAAVVALIKFLKLDTKGVSDPSELADDPFTIRAAAEEYSADPKRASLKPDELNERLNEWEKDLPRHSLNISQNVDASRVKKALDKGAEATGVWRCSSASISVYCAALASFPMRFMWPLFGPIVFLVGLFLYETGAANGGTSSWGSSVMASILSVAFASVSTVFYCAARGYHAIKWHRINRQAIREARTELNCAQRSEPTDSKKKFRTQMGNWALPVLECVANQL